MHRHVGRAERAAYHDLRQSAHSDGTERAYRAGWCLATYIKATYHTATISSTACQPFGMEFHDAGAGSRRRGNRLEAAGWEVVHVTWRPDNLRLPRQPRSIPPRPAPEGRRAPASAAPPSAPAISTVPEPRASYCFSDEHANDLLERPVRYSGLPSSAAWSTAFTKFLAQKYTATRGRSPAKRGHDYRCCKVWSWISATMPGRTSRSSTPTGPTNRPRLPPAGRVDKRLICR